MLTLSLLLTYLVLLMVIGLAQLRKTALLIRTRASYPGGTGSCPSVTAARETAVARDPPGTGRVDDRIINRGRIYQLAPVPGGHGLPLFSATAPKAPSTPAR